MVAVEKRNMQRIALAGCLLALLVAGCQTPERHSNLGPVPAPLLSTRPPPVVSPIPPPPPEPQVIPTPPPRRSTVTAADIRPLRSIAPGRWKTIIVHHSGSDASTPQGMDSWHRQRGWAGLGYHFVIGNGVNYPDGQLFVGPRWRLQQTGAHCKSSAGTYLGAWRPNNFFNEHGIGICLIGDFEKDRPTARQLQTLEDLITVLIQEADINPSNVFGHGEVTHKTACPGRYMNMAQLRRNVAARAARQGATAASTAGRRL